MRRVPKQARSQQRVDEILNTAADVFREVGYTAATTNEIAARCGIPIGSLYQFFPNKEAVLEALIERYTADLHALNERLLAPEQIAHLRIDEVIERLVYGLAEFEATHAGFNTLFLNTMASGPLMTHTQQLHSEVIQRVDAMIAVRYPQISPPQRFIAARAGVAMLKSLMTLAGPPDHLPLERVLTEIKAAMLAYISDVISRAESPSQKEDSA